MLRWCWLIRMLYELLSNEAFDKHFWSEDNVIYTINELIVSLFTFSFSLPICLFFRLLAKVTSRYENSMMKKNTQKYGHCKSCSLQVSYPSKNYPMAWIKHIPKEVLTNRFFSNLSDVVSLSHPWRIRFVDLFLLDTYIWFAY